MQLVTFDGAGNEIITEKQSQYVCPGDIVKLEGTTASPVDLLLILTSIYADGNKCYIETANIDGETNLKVRPLLLVFRLSMVLFVLLSLHQLSHSLAQSFSLILSVAGARGSPGADGRDGREDRRRQGHARHVQRYTHIHIYTPYC